MDVLPVLLSSIAVVLVVECRRRATHQLQAVNSSSSQSTASSCQCTPCSRKCHRTSQCTTLHHLTNLLLLQRPHQFKRPPLSTSSHHSQQKKKKRSKKLQSNGHAAPKSECAEYICQSERAWTSSHPARAAVASGTSQSSLKARRCLQATPAEDVSRSLQMGRSSLRTTTLLRAIREAFLSSNQLTKSSRTSTRRCRL